MNNLRLRDLEPPSGALHKLYTRPRDCSSMKNFLKLTSLAAITAATLTASALIGSSFAQGMGDMPMGNSGGMNMGDMKSMKILEKATGKTFDIYWMSQMIAHHNIAVEMANFVLKKGKDANVKKAAQDIVRVQSLEVKQMTGWLKEWYNAKPNAAQMKLMVVDMQPMVDASQGKMPGHSMSMGSPDKNFLENMIPHHQSAVDMAKLALTKALRPELKSFAQGVIDVQTEEIMQYQTWLKAMK
jgi:uncharacterized protein (DUF305 family)